MPKKIWLIAGAVTAAHGVAYVGCIMVALGEAMARFDHGGPATMVERLAFVGATVLGYPIANFVVKFGGPPGLRGDVAYADILANSLTWGIAAAGIAWWIGRRRHAGHGPYRAANS